MRDITLEDTIYIRFTTRAFATGVPATLAGTPVLSIYEENNLAQITSGVSITVDYDAVTGLNQATIAATAANGYELGKSYDLVITTGTVSAVSVVGEVVGSFTVGSSAAAVDLANTTDGLGAIKAETALIVADTAEIGTAGAGLTNIGTIATVTNLTNLPAITANWLTAAGIAAGALDGKGDWNIGKTGYSLTQAFPTNFADMTIEITTGKVNVKLTDTCTANTDMRGTDSAALASVATEARLSELDAATAGKVANQIDIIQTDTTTDIPAAIATAQADLDIITGVDGVNLLSATQASIDAIEVDTNDLQTSQGNWLTATGFATEAKQDIIDANVDAVLVDTGTTLPATLSAQDTAIADIPTVAEFEARTPTAAELLYIVRHAATAKPVTFTGGTTTTAVLGNVDGVAASSTDDAYNSRLLVFDLGTLDVQVCQITDYVGSTKTATISAVTTAVTSSHTAVLV